MKRDNEPQKLMGTTRASVHIRAAEGETESRTIEGYAIVFGQESVPLWKDPSGNTAVEVIAAEAVTDVLLKQSDIKMTMYHDMHRLLARSKAGDNGETGTLKWEIDQTGVKFSFDAPRTPSGDEALELVRSGDIDGCSFMFTTYYDDPKYVEGKASGKKNVYTVRKILGIYDFTLTPDPAYPQTECDARSRSVVPAKPIVDNSAQINEIRNEINKQFYKTSKLY